jgi:tetratricopeptide (TPR) repeat protein
MVETLDLVRTADPVAPRLVNPAIPRDLETVCLKCLRKESAQRYPTAGELAADLDRFLAGLPVVARPVGRAEKAWKWARRNPRVAGLLAALAAVIVLALGTTTYLWRQARDRERDAHQQRELADASRIRAELSETATLAAFYEAKVARAQAAAGEQRARTEATRAEGVAEFLGGLFEASDPLQISGTTAAIPRLRSEQLTAREMLLRGAEQLDQQSDLSPDARATLALRIGNSFLTIGDFLNAAKYLGVAKAGLEAILPPDHPDLAEVYHALAWLEQLRGNYDEAEPLYRRAAALQATLDQADPRNAMLLTTTWIKLGILLAEMGDTVPAAQLVEQARVRRAELAKADARYNRALGEAYLAAAVVAAEDGGLPALRKVQTFSEQGIGLLLGRGDDKLARAIHLFQEGLVLAYVQRRPQEAIGKLNECLELTQRVLGDRHLYSLIVRGQLAFVQDDFGDTAAAERNFRECLAIGKEQQVLTHPKAGRAFVRLARLLARTNRADEARAVLADWLGEHEKSNPDSLKHADALTDAAAVYIDLGDDAGGVKALGRAEAIYRTKLKGGRRTDFVSNQSQLAAAYSRQENWAAAEPRFAAALTAIDDHFPDDRSDDDYFKLIAGWSRSQVRLGRYPPEVETRLVEARAALAKDSKRRNRFALRTTLAVRLSEYYRGRGDPEKAIAVTREAAHEAVTGESLFAVAEELALCSDLAKGTESERLMAEAVKALRTAVRRGGVDANRIRATKAFTRLHDRTDFQELLDELSQPPP